MNTMCPITPADAGLIESSARIISDIAHEAAVAAGWWTAEDGTPLQNNRYVFAAKLMLCVSELAEACEGDRKSEMDKHLPHRPATEVELADAVIRCLGLGAGYGLDVPGAIAEKLIYNHTRPDHQPAARNAVGGKAY